MISIYLSKVPSPGHQCCNKDCTHNLNYHSQVFNGAFNVFYLIPNKICLIVSTTGWNNTIESYYCYDCIDLLYKDWKPILDKKLWPFK